MEKSIVNIVLLIGATILFGTAMAAYVVEVLGVMWDITTSSHLNRMKEAGGSLPSREGFLGKEFEDVPFSRPQASK